MLLDIINMWNMEKQKQKQNLDSCIQRTDWWMPEQREFWGKGVMLNGQRELRRTNFQFPSKSYGYNVQNGEYSQ